MIDFILRANNLTDEEGRSHTSFLKEVARAAERPADLLNLRRHGGAPGEGAQPRHTS